MLNIRSNFPLRLSFLILFLSSISSGQPSPPPSLATILENAAKGRAEYLKQFRDLISVETKNLVTYDKRNEIKKKRSIESTFLVYQVGTGDHGITEFRNVRSVDGRPVEDAEERTQTFINEIAKAGASGKELARIEKEGSRYDGDLTVNGMTLFQAPVLADNLRPYFRFDLHGNEAINGRDTFVVSYQQTRESPFVSTEPRSAANDGNTALVYDLGIGRKRASTLRVNGKLWIDAASFQILKETRILTAAEGDNTPPTPIAETVLEYQPSEFGIYTPKLISFTRFRTTSAGDNPAKDVAVLLEYGKFSKAKVEVKVVEVND